jgi:DNA polymerase III epsilon subunit-like protein
VYLTRRSLNPIADASPVFAALDLETTGLDPYVDDRVCEVAVVRFRADGTIVDEYATLIDPQRSVDATEHHGITDDDIADAPTFGEAWPDISRMLTGSVVVAHNLLFDDKFLSAELRRLGHPLPNFAGLCSAVTCRSQLDGPSYALQSLYRTATSEWIEDSHTALGDARALAILVQWLLVNAPTPLRLTGPAVSEADARATTPGRIVPRATRLSRNADGYLGAIARRFPLGADHPVDLDGARQYRAALDEIVADHRITGNEGWRMELLARRAGFTQQRLVAEHRFAWDRATAHLDLRNPDRLPSALRNRLVQLAHDLGHPTLASGLAADPEPSKPSTSYLRGWRIAVDGTRPAVQSIVELVADNGGALAKRITATVRLMVVDDPEKTSAQLEKAREFGISIVDPAGARKHLEPVLEAAAAAERERQHEQAQWQAERDRYVAEQDAVFRHRWRNIECPPDWNHATKRIEPDFVDDDDDEEGGTDWTDVETLSTETWQDEAATVDLPRGKALLDAWTHARDALAAETQLSAIRAAELGYALRVEFDLYNTVEEPWPPVGIYEDLNRLERIAGQVRGRFYVDWSPVLDEYRTARRDDDALDLLLDVIAGAERVAQVDGGPPAPAYTERAAVIYRRRREHDEEVAILERWAEAVPSGPVRGAGQKAVLQRLEAARRLQHRARQTGA